MLGGEELAGVLGYLVGRDVGDAGDAGLDGGICYGCGDVRCDARLRFHKNLNTRC